jgi:tubulin polyglutamylase TTLL6/13
VAQPSLSHIYKTYHPDDIENQLCFQILGFDIMLDSELKPWLLEVNQSPSFTTSSVLDTRIKGSLIQDTLTLLNLSQKRKQRYINK